MDGTCGPRQKSMKCGPSVYSEKISPARSSISSRFIQSSAYFVKADVFGRHLALEGQVLGLQFLHARFDFFEILGRERRLALKVVVEAGVGGRTDAELGFGKQFQHRGRQQMRGRVPVDLERLRILRRQNLELGVFLERTRQVPKLSVDARDHGVVGQSRADGLRDVQGTAPGWNALLAAIGQSNGKAFAHVNFRLSGGEELN